MGIWSIAIWLFLTLQHAGKDSASSRLSTDKGHSLLGASSKGDLWEVVDSYSLPEAKPHPADLLNSTATILANSLRKQLANQITASLLDSTNQIPTLLPVTNWITGALDHLTNHIICRMAS